MDELIQVQIGSPAWCPAPGTEILDVVKRGDSPLLAIVEQQGRKYMAHCNLGESGSSRLWVYRWPGPGRRSSCRSPPTPGTLSRQS